MPTAVFRQEGDSIDYSSSGSTAAGAVVVQGDLVGVAKLDIPANRLGALAVEGVYEFPKTAGGGTALASGTRVYWDVVAAVATTNANAGMNPFLGHVVQAAADAAATVWVKLARTGHRNELVYSSEAASAAVSNTIVETAFDKFASIAAQRLKAGDVIRVRALVAAPSTNATDTLNLRLKIGAIEIVQTGAVDVANGDIGYFEADIVIRTAGAAGTLVAAGVVGLGTPAVVTAKAFAKASTVVDTTVNLDVKVTAQWSVASAGNSCRLDLLNVKLLSK